MDLMDRLVFAALTLATMVLSYRIHKLQGRVTELEVKIVESQAEGFHIGHTVYVPYYGISGEITGIDEDGQLQVTDKFGSAFWCIPSDLEKTP